jgi:Ca2+-transporting ATPase
MMSSCLTNATTVARLPGYLRIRVPGLYRSTDTKRTIESTLADIEHVTQVRANPLTGKVLVLFDPAVPVAKMLDTLGLQAANDESVIAAVPIGNRPAGRPQNRTQSSSALTAPKDRHHARQAKPTKDLYSPWHLRPVQETLAYHGVSRATGLTSSQVERRLRDGLNLLPPPYTRSSFELLASQFKSIPVALLGISALLSIATGGIAEAISIAAVLALNGGIGYATEKRAEATIASLSQLIDENAPVVRDGSVIQVPASQLVPGDLLVLARGSYVPADARVVHSAALTVDESSLTGESHAVHKHSAALSQPAALADRTNMVYMGTSVVAGSGLAVVVGTGEHTEIGAIHAAMELAEQPQTPLQKEMDSLGNRLVMISGLICLGVFGLGLLRGQGWLQMLKASIALAIAAVPEGLPTVATTSLARGLRVMQAKQMLIRRLQAVETIGAIHTICFDKTGTLTMNRMAVVTVSLGMSSLELINGQLQLPDPVGPSRHHDDITRLLQLCVLSNETIVHGDDPVGFLSSGSATENALVQLAAEVGVDVSSMRKAFPLLHAELRAEGKNHMCTVHAAPDGGRLIAVKGSPLEVLAMCTNLQLGSVAVNLNDEHRRRIEAANEQMARQQLRVLGFAYAEQASSDGTLDGSDNLVWLGLVGLADPLRIGAQQVIRQLHRAGIRTTMITGDQPTTAYAIGQSLGLAHGSELRILDSEHLEDLSPNELQVRAIEADIFARVSPAKKLHIVQALQQHGEVVAMTGDGVNDGPALRAADVGIAMGRHGTDLARSAADVVLADDRLETVLDAIRHGRTITNNIEKSLHFLISSNLSEILVALGGVAAAGSAPLTPMQLLWINLITDVLPAIALAAEPAEGDVMERPPRHAGQRLIKNQDLKRYGFEGTVIAGGVLTAYGYGLLRYGAGARASGLAFNTLVIAQLLHAYLCRSRYHGLFGDGKTERNRMLDAAIGGSIGLQAMANLIPGLRRLLGLGATGLLDLGVMLAAAGIPLLINDATKQRSFDGPKSPSSVYHSTFKQSV